MDNRYERIAQIVQRIRDGETEAFTELYDATYRSVFFHAGKVLDSQQDVEDIVQETYLRLFQKLDTIQTPKAIVDWLNTTASFLAMNKLREAGNRYAEGSLDDEEFDYQPLADTELQPEMVLDKAATAEIIQNIINPLPERQAMALTLRSYDELSIPQIAKVMGCPENTVKSHLNYARKKIQKAVQAEEKRGIKLYSITPELLVYALYRMVYRNPIPRASYCQVGAAVASAGSTVKASAEVSARTASAVSRRAAGSVTRTGARKGGKYAATKAVAGAGSTAAKVVAVKVTAAVLAASTAIGGTAAVVHVVKSNQAPASITVEASLPMASEAAETSEEVLENSEPVAETVEVMEPMQETQEPTNRVEKISIDHGRGHKSEIQCSYNSKGLLTDLTYSGDFLNEYQFTYNENDQLTGYYQNGVLCQGYEYTDGQLTKRIRNYVNMKDELYSEYNDQGQLIREKTANGETVMEYTYGTDGRLRDSTWHIIWEGWNTVYHYHYEYPEDGHIVIDRTSDANHFGDKLHVEITSVNSQFNRIQVEDIVDEYPGALGNTMTFYQLSALPLMEQFPDLGYIAEETHSSFPRIQASSVVQNANGEIVVMQGQYDGTYYVSYSKPTPLDDPTVLYEYLGTWYDDKPEIPPYRLIVEKIDNLNFIFSYAKIRAFGYNDVVGTFDSSTGRITFDHTELDRYYFRGYIQLKDGGLEIHAEQNMDGYEPVADLNLVRHNATVEAYYAEFPGNNYID